MVFFPAQVGVASCHTETVEEPRKAVVLNERVEERLKVEELLNPKKTVTALFAGVGEAAEMNGGPLGLASTPQSYQPGHH